MRMSLCHRRLAPQACETDAGYRRVQQHAMGSAEERRRMAGITVSSA
jgi:hypothetical protein